MSHKSSFWTKMSGLSPHMKIPAQDFREHTHPSPQLWDRIQVLGAAVPQARGEQLRNTQGHLPASAEATSPGSADKLTATPKHDHSQPCVRLWSSTNQLADMWGGTWTQGRVEHRGSDESRTSLCSSCSFLQTYLTGRCQVLPQNAFLKAVLPHAMLHQKQHGKGMPGRRLLRYAGTGLLPSRVCGPRSLLWGSLPRGMSPVVVFPIRLSPFLHHAAVLYAVGNWQVLAELLLPVG